MRRKNLEDGCSTTLVAALTPASASENGSYLADCQVGNPKATTKNTEAAEKLWALSEKLVGERFYAAV